VNKNHSSKRRMFMMKNLALETARFVRSGFKTRTREEQERVISICEQCTLYKINTRLGPRCSECGCCMNVKKKWITAHCPKDKW